MSLESAFEIYVKGFYCQELKLHEWLQITILQTCVIVVDTKLTKDRVVLISLSVSMATPASSNSCRHSVGRWSKSKVKRMSCNKIYKFVSTCTGINDVYQHE